MLQCNPFFLLGDVPLCPVALSLDQPPSEIPNRNISMASGLSLLDSGHCGEKPLSSLRQSFHMEMLVKGPTSP